MSDDVIRASEISEYIFCRRAWWLRRVAGRQGRNARELGRGMAFHEAHGQLLGQAQRARLLAYALVFLAVAAIVFGIIQAI